MRLINDIVAASHFFVARYGGLGDAFVDATAGNGRDTLFLARLAGPQGRVHAFDIQAQALTKTRSLLESEGLGDAVSYHLVSHSAMKDFVQPPVKAIMFNLGYLPGAAKEIVTTARETLAALARGIELLGPGGIISVVAYPGHPGGEWETDAVAEWCCSLSQGYTVMSMRVLPDNQKAPQLWIIKNQA